MGTRLFSLLRCRGILICHNIKFIKNMKLKGVNSKSQKCITFFHQHHTCITAYIQISNTKLTSMSVSTVKPSWIVHVIFWIVATRGSIANSMLKPEPKIIDISVSNCKYSWTKLYTPFFVLGYITVLYIEAFDNNNIKKVQNIRYFIECEVATLVLHFISPTF
jgi:hypothetical protein